MPFNNLDSQDLQDAIVNKMLAGGFEKVDVSLIVPREERNYV
jgi:hypothetical protein